MLIVYRSIQTLTIAVGCSWACGGDVGKTNDIVGATSGGSTSGTASGGAATNGASGSVALPFDPTAGCRDLSISGCSRCCTTYVDQNGAEQCGVSEASQDSTTYGSVAGSCGSDCPVCARCTVQDQQTLDNATNTPRPECYCPTVGSGVDPCMDSSGCECFCNNLMGAVISCPQSGQAACNNGNHCSAFLATSPGPYAPGDLLEAVWINYGTESVYLGNCGNLAFERNDIGTMTTLLQASPCSVGATGLLASDGGSLAWKINIPSNVGVGQLWLHGTYYIGCDSSIPNPSHCATGPLDTYYIIDVRAQ